MAERARMANPRRAVATKILAAIMAVAAATAAARAADLETLEEEAFRAAVDKVAPAVVQIETVGGQEQVAGMLAGSGPTTGVVIEPAGYLISSSFNLAHDPAAIIVRLADGRRLAATLVAADESRKVSLLKVDPEEPLAAAEFADPAEIRVGQWAIAVGRAFDHQRPNIAVGIVSGLDRVWGKAMQTDAAVSPNNYGGPLVDLHGRVLGILVPMSPASDEETAGVEWYDSGIGFAVPGGALRTIVRRLKQGANLKPGLLGVTLDSASVMTSAPRVAQVHANSPAEEAGLRRGDRIVRIAGRAVQRSAEMRRELAQHYAGDQVSIAVERGGETIEVEAALVARLEPYECPVLGILPERQAAAGKPAADGAPVRFVFPGSPADKAGLAEGERIVAVDGEPVADAAALRARIARRKPGEAISLLVASNGQQRTVNPTLEPSAESIPAAVPAALAERGENPGETTSLTLPDWPNRAAVYLPKGYRANAAAGLLLWLVAPGSPAGASALEPWKSPADERGLIVVVPEPASPERWLGREAEMAEALLRLAMQRFSIDPLRVAVGGQEAGGTLAYLVAGRRREAVRGLVLVDGLLAGPPVRDDPRSRLSILIAVSNNGPHAGQIERSLAALRQLKLPLAVLPRDAAPGALEESEAAAIAGWIDCLDRI
ncbi:MAG: PDZ domain-containing protein [Pirellulales bacterium]|nr:PDZ domain-containing protein [Thermoguttaceae bacterium]MDD4788587.1 PDZ domain-containing protein [Pirellulales bacterium]